MSTVVDLRKTDDPRDAIHRAVHLLAEGHIVAFPTETVYAACVHALMTAAVQKLSAVARKRAALIRPSFSRDFKRRSIMSRDMDRLGQRLARRCWPGPVTLAFDVGSEMRSVRWRCRPRRARALAPGRSQLWIRVPARTNAFKRPCG